MGAKISLFDPIGCCTTLQDDINNEVRNKKEEIMTQDTMRCCLHTSCYVRAIVYKLNPKVVIN